MTRLICVQILSRRITFILSSLKEETLRERYFVYKERIKHRLFKKISNLYYEFVSKKWNYNMTLFYKNVNLIVND